VKKNSFAILGAGNAGHAYAAHLSMRGFDVSIAGIPEDEQGRLIPIRQRGGIEITGIVSGFGTIDPENVTTSVETAVEDRNVIIMAVPAHGHEYFFEKLVSSVENGQTIVITPDYFGTFILTKMLGDMGVKKNIKIVGTQSMVYGCRLAGPAKVYSGGFKDLVLSASLPGRSTDSALLALRTVYPQYISATNIIEVNLANPFFIICPILILANLARTELKKDFFIYKETTPAMAHIMESMDRERIQLGKALGIRLSSLCSTIKTMYSRSSLEGKDLYELFQKNPLFGFAKGPDSIRNLFVMQEVPFGLVPLASLCCELGVECPTVEAVIQLLSVSAGEDFFDKGLSTEKLGLKDLTGEKINKLVR